MHVIHLLFSDVGKHILRAHKTVKVNGTLVQALRLCTGRTAYRGSRGIALLFHDHGTRRGWGISVKPRPFFTPGKDPVPIVQEAGWAPGLVWTGAENLAPTGIRSPDRPARSQSLYRLRYSAHAHEMQNNNVCKSNDVQASTGRSSGWTGSQWKKCTNRQINGTMEKLIINKYIFYHIWMTPI